MFIENLLGSKAKVKLLRVLSETRTAFRLQDIKNETELSLGIIHKSVQELVEEGILIKIKGSRKERLFKFNPESPFSHNVFELFQTEKTLQRNEVVLLHTWNILENAVAKIKEKSRLIILFGSQARGEATLRSDIDLLVIPRNSQGEILDALRGIKSGNKINPTVVSLGAFKDDIKNDTLFYKNIKKDSLILHMERGIEMEIKKFIDDITPEFFVRRMG